ncbi:CDF-like metal transporter [Laccaria bicolor S238N-H82]|uniref:CDF-like metal transporter n=1 Tax=Laccaria bicolor (strain S238N-H82 / ATCC MYA-4686) TaxID=486041 RepID=B0DR95_LACBS|nr:CDF-like metal transporter [Laccaria bicolor S238N-H82]EDR02833.1 CDF-like metal transporter [Laccaria bicolor S238N-H82]|eukprot:XP_001886543.1 CDF-like metal transporter [Laccaria bicolor S238N-H82]
MKNVTRIGIILGISIAFFIAEITAGIRTKSLALLADAFHYLNDIIAFALAYVAAHLQETRKPTDKFTFAFHRAELVGAFFNSVFLLALALSIFLQSIERFIHIAPVNSPLMMMVIGCVGLGLNILSAFFAHEHHGHGHGHSHSHSHSMHGHSHVDERNIHPIELKEVTPVPIHIHASHNHTVHPPSSAPEHNLGLLAVMVHLLGDAINSTLPFLSRLFGFQIPLDIGVIIASVIMWKLDSPYRFYADPMASLIISFVIFGGTIPTTLKTGRMLLEATPTHVDLTKVKEDLISASVYYPVIISSSSFPNDIHLSQLPDVLSIHDVHVWSLSQSIVLASLHVLIRAGTSFKQWEMTERYMQQCFNGYGITHITISPEIQKDTESVVASAEDLVGGCKYTSQDDFGCSVTDLRLEKRRIGGLV